MADHQIVIAGFGGQGLLFSGKVLAYTVQFVYWVQKHKIDLCSSLREYKYYH